MSTASDTRHGRSRLRRAPRLVAVLAVTAALVPAAPVLAERAGSLRPGAAAPDRTPTAQTCLISDF